MKKIYVFIGLLLCSAGVWGQNPTNGGFENGSISATDWTVTAGTSSVSATNARTGNFALSHTTSSTASNVPVTNANIISIPNLSYGIVIGWAIGDNVNARASVGGTLNGTTNSTAIATIGTTLTRLTHVSPQNITGSAVNFTCRINSRSVSGAITDYWDDVIMYSSTTNIADITKPSTATAFTNGTITSNSINFTWTNGSDAGTGIQNTIILRTTNLAAATPVMNDQGVYSTTGGANGPNIVSTDWNVISTSVGAATTTYTDLTVAASTSYKYAVIHRDLAYNYSTALVSGTITTLSSGTPTVNVTPTSLAGFISLVSPAFSAEQTYAVDGSNLTNDIIITPPVGFQISLSSGGGFITNPAFLTLTQSGGTVASTTIYVRMNSATLGLNTGNVTNTSTGSNNPNVSLTGKVLDVEPTVQSAITFGAITNTTMVVNFSGGNGAKRILVARSGSAVNSNPVDGTTYSGNAVFGLGTQLGVGNYAVYAGTGNSVLVSGLAIGTTYHFAVYEYNDGNVSGAENYLVPGGVNNATTTAIPVVYIWNGGSSSWTTATNWLPTRLFPASNDILEFLDGTTETVTNVPTETIGQLNIMNVTGGTNVTLQAAATNSTLTIGGLILGTDLTVDAGCQLNIDGANSYAINLATGATGTIDGSMTFTGTAAVGTSAHKLTAADASGITFNSGSIFTMGTGSLGNPFGPSPTATANSVVFTSGSTFIQVGGANPFALTQPSSVVIFNTGSLFKLMANLTPSVSGRTYANFELDAPALTPIIATGTALLTMDNLTVTNGSISFGMTTAGFDLKGNVSVAAGDTLRFNPASAGTLTFKGTSPQSISNAGTLTFGANQNVTMNNAAGVTLNTPVTLLSTLTFTSGIVTTTATNLLTLGVSSSVASASNASFVNGPVSKIGNTDFTFPVGKPNCGPSGTVPGYAPVYIYGATGSAPTDQYTAEYIRASSYSLGPINNVGLKRVSSCDYWTLNQVAGTSILNVRLYWNDAINNCTTASPYVNDLPALVIAHFDGGTSTWSTFGTTGTASGTNAAGYVDWSGVSTFSPFAIGSINFANPLPISINYFTGTKQSGHHLLNWKVNCASSPSATLELERSSDGRTYNSIYSIVATALRCQQPFDYTDNQPAKGVNYYRLKMTDVNGKINYSSIVPLINAVSGMEVMNIAPNPIVNGTFNLKVSAAVKTAMDIAITDMQGRILQKQTVSMTAGFNTIPVDVRTLAAGTYQLVGNTADGKTRTLRFVVQ